MTYFIVLGRLAVTNLKYHTLEVANEGSTKRLHCFHRIKKQTVFNYLKIKKKNVNI